VGHIKYRRRGTVILETPKGILLTAGRPGKPFILPGGGAERGESRFVAALRELTEETHLLPHYAEIIFRHDGKIRPTKSGRGMFQDHHTVCLVKATGAPRPGGGDAKRIGYYYPGCDVWISTTTKEIIERYYKWKDRNQVLGAPQIVDDDASVDDDVDTMDDYEDE
jgi:8-oxo-dGTP diphosphatase